jgi:hypothetical protein
MQNHVRPSVSCVKSLEPIENPSKRQIHRLISHVTRDFYHDVYTSRPFSPYQFVGSHLSKHLLSFFDSSTKESSVLHCETHFVSHFSWLRILVQTLFYKIAVVTRSTTETNHRVFLIGFKVFSANPAYSLLLKSLILTHPLDKSRCD